VNGPRAALERLSLAALDVAGIAVGLRAAHMLYARTLVGVGLTAPPLSAFTTLVVVQTLVLLLAFYFQQLYHQPRGASRLDLVGQIFRSSAVGIIVAFALTGLLSPELNALESLRFFLIYNWLATLIALIVARLLHRASWSALHRFGVGRLNVLVVGAGPAGADLVARIQRQPWLGYEVVGFLDDTPGRTRVRGVPIVGSTDELGPLVKRLAIDEVLIALPGATRSELVALVSQCDREGTTIKILPDVFHIMTTEVQVSDLDGLPLLAIRDVALRGWRRSLKRALDITVSGILLVLLSPLILLLALLVKLESKGPAFYVQERMGLDMRPFPIIKLRSMRPGAESSSGAVWARRGDPRVTRLGAFMRRTNLDELPQLVNVLLGHMSLVGPRPERPEFVSEFRRHIPRYAERHRERGGITGWAQVNGLRGNTSIEERTKYDLYYIENWSILFDLKILFRTALQSFRDPNAY
jgi:exopolysaccharide biosynthesis polyprenyl glycosylphosphotransferase